MPKANHTYVTKTLEFADFFDSQQLCNPEDYLRGINKRWLIESVVYMISSNRFNSFSMEANKCLHVMFQDYEDKPEVQELFSKLRILEKQNPGVWLTLINHRAQYSLLRRILLMPSDKNGKGESFTSFVALLKAILVENSLEMEREREILGKIDKTEPDMRDAMIFIQQDILNLDLFGDNKKELEKAQMLKYLMLCKFGKEQREIGNAIKQIVSRGGLLNEYDYLLLADLPLAIYHDKYSFGEGLILLRRDDFVQHKGTKLWESFVAYISDKCLDIWDLEKLTLILSDEELLDNTSFRKYPVLKLSETEYLVISQTYYSHLFYDGFWWAIKDELKKSMSNEAVMNLLTREFSENRLFYGVVSQMKGDNRMRLFNENCFPSQQSAPDLAIMTRKRLYMFEYKDIRVDRNVSDASDMGVVMKYIDDRLNKEKDSQGGNKGLTQLIRNIEDYYTGKTPWAGMAEKGSITVSPVLVVNSRLFGVRGINFIMQKKMKHRIMESDVLRNHVDEIAELLVVDMDMMILVCAMSNNRFEFFQQTVFDYQTHTKNGRGPYDKFDSYRNYNMNKWAYNKTEDSDRQFQRGYKTLVNILV